MAEMRLGQQASRRVGFPGSPRQDQAVGWREAGEWFLGSSGQEGFCSFGLVSPAGTNPRSAREPSPAASVHPHLPPGGQPGSFLMLSCSGPHCCAPESAGYSDLPSRASPSRTPPFPEHGIPPDDGPTLKMCHCLTQPISHATHCTQPP